MSEDQKQTQQDNTNNDIIKKTDNNRKNLNDTLQESDPRDCKIDELSDQCRSDTHLQSDRKLSIETNKENRDSNLQIQDHKQPEFKPLTEFQRILVFALAVRQRVRETFLK